MCAGTLWSHPATCPPIDPHVHPTSHSISVCPSSTPTSIHLSIQHPTLQPSVHPSNPIHPSFCLSIYHPSLHSSVHHPPLHPSIHLSIHHSTCPSNIQLHLSVHPSTRPSLGDTYSKLCPVLAQGSQTLPLFQGKYRPQTPETQEAPLVHRAASHSRTPSPGRGAGPQPPRGQD